jgi:hypothetical protein
MIGQSGAQSLQHLVPVSPVAAVLFCPWKKSYLGDGTLLIGQGIGFKCKPQTLVIMRKLKYLWEKSLARPATSESEQKGGVELIELVTELLLSVY